MDGAILVAHGVVAEIVEADLLVDEHGVPQQIAGRVQHLSLLRHAHFSIVGEEGATAGHTCADAAGVDGDLLTKGKTFLRQDHKAIAVVADRVGDAHRRTGIVGIVGGRATGGGEATRPVAIAIAADCEGGWRGHTRKGILCVTDRGGDATQGVGGAITDTCHRDHRGAEINIDVVDDGGCADIARQVAAGAGNGLSCPFAAEGHIAGAVSNAREASLPLKETTTGVLFQPLALAAGVWLAAAVGAVRSTLMSLMTAGALTLPARSLQVPLADCPAPSLLSVTSPLQVAMPERPSLPLKETTTGVLFQPLALATGVRLALAVDAVKSTLTV